MKNKMTTARDIMSSNVKVCTPQDSVSTAAQIMRDINCGSVPVCEGKNVVGMITDRDIVIKSVADSKDINTVTCQHCMTTNVVSASPDTDVHELSRTMAEHQIRRIPIVDQGELVGMVAIGDLAKVNIFVNEAGDALSQISEQTH
ncbi:CBS domain-containing protein [Paenibacillus sp. LBL]|nr:CBS domain-containing protein [Paenibacillus sp. LBL]